MKPRASLDRPPEQRYMGGSRMRVDEFIEKIKRRSRDDVAGIRSDVMNEIKHLLGAASIRGADGARHTVYQGYAIRTTHNALVEYRAAAIDAFGKAHPVIGMLKLSEAYQSARNRADEGRVYAQHVQLKPLYPTRMVEIARDLLSSTSVFDVANGIALFTGRRSYEIIVTGSFEKPEMSGPTRLAGIPIGSDDSLIFGGQAKTKQSANAQTTPYRIPLLAIEPEEILEAIQRVRTWRRRDGGLYGELIDNKQFNAATANSLGKNCKDAFGLDFTPSTLRAAYGTIANQWFKPPSVSSIVFFADILGHSPTQYTTALSYMEFYDAESDAMEQLAEIGEAKRQLVRDVFRSADETESMDPERAAVLRRQANSLRELVDAPVLLM